MKSDETIDTWSYRALINRRAQVRACRAVLAEVLYCNRQLHTVLHMREVEIAEQAKQIEALQRMVKGKGSES